MEKVYDVIIIGSGPAGLSAAVYAARGGLDFLVIESAYASGGQVLNTGEVDNYLGFHNIDGFELGMKFKEHATNLEAEFVNKKVTEIKSDSGSDKKEEKEITCEDGTVYKCHNLILATGATARKLGVEGEKEFSGKGVSYCATCDGGFFKGKEVAVVGGGDTALEDAIYLSKICEKVYVIHRRDAFRGAKSLEMRLLECENVEILWNTVVERINGLDKVENINVRNVQIDMPGELKVDGIFIAIGTTPNSQLLKGIVEMNDGGYVMAGENCATNRDGIFVAGDVRQKPLRQIVTAVSDGANAINTLIMRNNDR